MQRADAAQRKAVAELGEARGELKPLGAGPKRSHLFTIDELNRFATARAARYAERALGTPGRKDDGSEERDTDTLSGRVPHRRQHVLRTSEATDPRTGKQKEIAKLLEGVSAQASQKRLQLIEAVTKPAELTKKLRVGEFARSWIESKSLRLDATTAKTYADALENHILPALGDFYYDMLTSQDVQRWIDDAVKYGWSTDKRVSRGKKHGRKSQRAYSRYSILQWFRTFRTMTRDAMVALDLPRDPSLRVHVPEAGIEPDEANAFTPDELAQFLEAMRAKHPQHYPFVVLLAYTGLRFCHTRARSAGTTGTSRPG